MAMMKLSSSKLVTPAKNNNKKNAFSSPTVPSKLQDLLQLVQLGDWLTFGPISIAKEIGSSNRLTPVLPPELGGRITHTESHRLRLQKDGFPQKTGVPLPKKGEWTAVC